jgi:hypothetical protein
MSNEQREETVMKKVALIAVAVIAFGTMAAVAHAKPVAATHPGISQAEYRALLLRSEGLNQLYGVHAAVPVRGENYYARGIPTSTPNTIAASPSTSTDFQWGDAGIGAGVIFGLTALLAVGAAFRRHQLHVGTS